MIWKNKELNQYPKIILSDCEIVNMQLRETDIVISFSSYGFIKKNDKDNKFYRTNGAQIVIEGYDAENLSIKEIRTHQLSEELYFDSMYDVDTNNFYENINSGKWKFEIVEEFYSSGGAYYIGQIHEEEVCFWCHICIRFRNLVYFWNDIKYDWPID